MDLTVLQTEAREWQKKNFGLDRPAHWPLIGVVEELGELAHAHLKREQGIRLNEDHIAKAKDAVGDIVVFLADYCTAMDFDFGQVVSDVWTEVKERDYTNERKTGKTTT